MKKSPPRRIYAQQGHELRPQTLPLPCPTRPPDPSHAASQDPSASSRLCTHSPRPMPTQPARSQAATAATGLPAGRVRGDGRHVLDAADLEPGARQGAEGVLRAGAGGLGLVAARCPHLDVHGRDAELLWCKRRLG